MNTKRLLLKSLGGVAAAPTIAAVAAAIKPAAKQLENYFPNVIVETHDGRKVRFYDDLIKGKVVIINAMYTVCTGVCPTNTASLRSVQAALGDRVGKDIFLYSITLQPELDSPAALRDYAKKYGVKSGWTFLTGKRPDIDLIRRKLGFYDSDPVADADIANHAGVFRIGNETRERWFMMPAATSTRQIVTSVLNVI